MSNTPLLFDIKPNQRVATLGMTDTGKTFLNRAILSKQHRLIAIDPKGLLHDQTLWRLDKWEQGIEKLRAGKPARLWVNSPLDENEYEEVFNQIMRLRNVLVYIDELYGVGPPSGSRGLRALYTRGRELGIGIWSSFQRPRWIPVYALSEAEWKIMFRLEMEQDRDYMASMGFGKYAYLPLPEHSFILKDPKGKITIFPNGITAKVAA